MPPKTGTDEIRRVVGSVSAVGDGAATVVEAGPKAVLPAGIQFPADSSEAMDQLASVFAAYNETTHRLRVAHQRLKNEVARLRRELHQKNEQLERQDRLAALGQMAAGIAHEIRNPLGGIQLYASLLESDLSAQVDQLQLVRKISKGVKSLDMIVNDILAFTQDQNCHKSKASWSSLAGEVMDYVAPHIAGGDIVIDTNHTEQDLEVQVEVGMMRRVLLNLLLNAVEGLKGQGLIQMGAHRVADEPPFSVQIDIADNGPGIEEEVMGKIFNPFFTTKESGTGLGLTIAHRLVECHGGQIRVANNEHGGATFSIYLP